jgi:hypothetical protein
MLELFLKEIETKNGNSVRIISLNNNRITDSGFALLTSVIPRFPNLRILYLSKYLLMLIVYRKQPSDIIWLGLNSWGEVSMPIVIASRRKTKELKYMYLCVCF